MAANNYYGFTHGGTQYTGTGGAQSYQTNQAYGQGYSAPAGRGTSGAYDAYQPNHTASAATYTYPPREAGSAGPGAGQSYEYGYARSSTTFEGAKSYYQGHNAATPKGPAAKNPAAYGGAAQNPGPRHAAPKAAQPYGYGNQYAGNKNYDASLYGATNSYMQGNANGGRGRGKWGPGFKKGPGGPPGGPKVLAVGPGPQTKPKPIPKQPQIHYCDVCKISCAGPQTFKEHLEGQKHKKKDAANKLADTASPAVAAVVKPPPNSLRCELCDVACTGADAYAAHIRGVKHQKVVKLHTKLGKVIPPSDPVPIVPAAPKEVARPTINPAPKITFTSQSIAEKSVEMDPESSDVHPVGQEFIEEVVLEGKPTSFQCKLCDCRFNDPNAKEMHMKGRKHRLQYKRKVNPELVVDPKPNSRQKKLNELKQIRSNIKEEMWLKRQGDLKLMDEEERIYWDERRRFEEDLEYLEWYRRYGQDSRAGPPPRPLGSSMMVMRRPSTADDRHVSAKHTQIYPSNEELQTVQKIVSNTEKALKLVSDEFAEADGPKVKEETTPAVKPETKEVDKDDSTKDDTSGDNQRFLKGVMRVGVLAKGLLLRGDIHVQLVILCSDKPTKTLLNRVANSLPKHLIAVAAGEKYDIKNWIEKAAIVVSSTVDPKVTVTVTLTSPLTRETPEGHTDKDPRDLLDKQKCLEALAALRHAKWFQAKAAGLQSCVMITRILRDLCQRIPTWTPLNSWAMELLAEKVISSAGQPLSPGDALRRILEAVASGVLLPEGPGLLDPCEKDPLDATVGMTKQEREDITASAQHALRLIAFRQIHKVLGMDALPPPPKPQWGKFTRKRRRDNSTSETVEQGDGKKDKKDVGDSMETEVPAEAKA